jgi:MGT family glycosyltransferase
MSTFLIYTSPARGHLYPIMDVALALRAAGHRVVVQTLADERERVTTAGLEHRPIARGIEALPLRDFAHAHPGAQVRATYDTWLARAPLEIDDLGATVAELAPDGLVIDANTWGAAAFAESLRRPWSSFLPYALPLPSPDTPAFGPGFAPPRHALDRLRDRALWAVLNGAVRRPLRGLAALRAELGVPPIGAEGLYLRSDALLYRTAVPFDYPRAHWPASVHAIGPGLWAPPGEAPAWLADLPHPRVLVNVSTEFQDDGAIVEAAIAGLADDPGSVIVTTSAVDPARFVAPHDRVRITRTLPHAAVIPAVDVVVTHGGMGTTQRALAAGVPVCVVPWGRDQHETARRAVVCGAGTMLPRSRLTPERLWSAVHDALGRSAGAARIASAFRDAGGAARGVAVLEGLMHARDAGVGVAA